MAKQNSTNLIDLNNSGATSVSSWVKKISGVVGIVTDPSGNVVDLPLQNNYEKGLSNFEYFVAARGSRKSFADVALRTADSGYLTRRLVDVAQDMITNTDDCGTEESLEISRKEKRLQSFANRLKGRYLAKDLADPKTGEVIAKKSDAITLELAKKIEANEAIEVVHVRSPLTCKIAHGICRMCYGYDNGTGQLVEIGEAVGVIAAQALGEPTTQLTLKSKSDARAVKSDVTQGLPRVEELLEARTPKALALLADISGKVKVIEEKKRVVIRISANKKVGKKFDAGDAKNVVVKDGAKVKAGDTLAVKNKKELKAEFAGKVSVEGSIITLEGEKEVEVEKEADSMINLIVRDGDEVQKGDQLTFGSIDPKEMAKLKGLRDAQKYIVAGVQDVYGIQGLEVDDRHLEVVARQMSRYGLITESGDSENYLPADYADALDIDTENEILIAKGLKPIKYERVLLGVTNSAIRTESFLSAASFEQQVRVLTDAALIGKVDNLRGLKENVIIGRPVPLGDELKRRMGLIKDEVEPEVVVESETVVEEPQNVEETVETE